MTIQAAQALIDRFSALYGEPKTDDVQKFVAEYVRALSPWSQAVLERAGDAVIEQQTHRFWPMPGTVVKACREACEEVSTTQQPVRHPEWSSAAIAAADALVQSPLGRQAAEEGWITQLHDYCRRVRTLPTPDAIASLKREARLFEEAYHIVSSGGINIPPLAAQIKTLGDRMLVRRDRHAEIANTEIAE